MLRRLRIENLVLIREVELELGAGLNVLSGETGAGKTIFAQAIGLLLGVKGDASAVGPTAGEAYVEAEFDVPDGFFDESGAEALAELRPEDEPGLILARRVFGDGRTRAYAWGRAIAREDLAAASERLIAMSGQFEQRRLARPGYQLDVLDAFVGAEQAERRARSRSAWKALTAARRHHEEIARDAGAAAARVEALRDLVERTEGLQAGEEELLRSERDRMRHAAELAEGAARATAAVSPDDGDGAASLAAAAGRALEPLTRLAPELEGPAAELRELTVRLSEVGSDLHRFVATLEADPARQEEVEARLDLIAELRRRFDAQTLEDLLERRETAAADLDALDGGLDPLAAAAAELHRAEAELDSVITALSTVRAAAVEPFAAAVAETRSHGGTGLPRARRVAGSWPLTDGRRSMAIPFRGASRTRSRLAGWGASSDGRGSGPAMARATAAADPRRRTGENACGPSRIRRCADLRGAVASQVLHAQATWGLGATATGYPRTDGARSRPTDPPETQGGHPCTNGSYCPSATAMDLSRSSGQTT